MATASKLAPMSVPSGTTPLAFKLRRDADLLRAEAEQAAERVGRSWVEQLELAVSPPGSSADAGDGGALAELDRLMRADIAGDALREDVGRLVRELSTDLPAELRDAFGADETALAGGGYGGYGSNQYDPLGRFFRTGIRFNF